MIATLYFRQEDRGMPVFRGSSWRPVSQFWKDRRTDDKKRGKSPWKITLASMVNLLGDVLSGKNPKQAAKACALEGANVAKMQAIQRAQRYAQTGRGRSKSTKRSTKRRAKKRKASPSVTKRKPTKRARTSPQDIFG